VLHDRAPAVGQVGELQEPHRGSHQPNLGAEQVQAGLSQVRRAHVSLSSSRYRRHQALGKIGARRRIRHGRDDARDALYDRGPVVLLILLTFGSIDDRRRGQGVLYGIEQRRHGVGVV
jgi:hypothetical protein